MKETVGRIVVGGVVVLMMAASPALAKRKPAPVPPPPPAPRYVYVDWKPVPPEFGPPNLSYPAPGPDGVRPSVNRNISPAQTLWNLRSGFNVAALNCLNPKHAAVLVNYKSFLKTHAKTLKATNAKVDAEWRARYGAGFVKPREKYMTEVYNHFAIPPIKSAFCDAALAMSNDAKAVKTADLSKFAATALPNLEIVFDDFFRRYDQYYAATAAWETKWGKAAVPGSRVLEASIPITASPAVTTTTTK